MHLIFFFTLTSFVDDIIKGFIMRQWSVRKIKFKQVSLLRKVFHSYINKLYSNSNFSSIVNCVSISFDKLNSHRRRIKLVYGTQKIKA